MIALMSQTKLPDSSNPLSDIVGAVHSAISRRSIASFVCQLFAQPDTHVRENLGISKPD